MKERKPKWIRQKWRKIKFFVTHYILEEKRDETRTFKCNSTALYFRKLTDDRLFGRKNLNKTKRHVSL